MENIEQMEERHRLEKISLQKLCKHENTQRLPFMWAPGHYGNDVEVCDWCGKIMKWYKDEAHGTITKTTTTTS